MLETPPPLSRARGGAPLLYAALGAYFQLEPLVPEDEEALAAAHEDLLDWLGPSLRFTTSHLHAGTAPFDVSDLELAPALASRVVNPEQRSDPAAQVAASRAAAFAIAPFGVACHGGAVANAASPWGYRFHATATDAGHGPILRVLAALSFTVPTNSSLADFTARTLKIAAKLRLRWGTVGFTFSGWEHDRFRETRRAMRAHAERHPGFDVGLHATHLPLLHDRLRTVSWLTLLGPGLRATLEEKGGVLSSAQDVELADVGEHVALRAGGAPALGDRNRRVYPDAYRRVDEMLRPIRAESGLHFHAPWSQRSTEAWLRRFETC